MDSDEIAALTGSTEPYNYQELPLRCSDDEIQAYIQRTRELFTPIAKRFDDKLNTEWFARNYLSLKLALGATILATSAEHAERQNLQATLPYLNYYAILNCCRSFVISLPCITWQGIKTIEMTHQNIINTSADKLQRLGLRHKDMLEPRLWAAKEQRDLFSYRFPATGLSIFGDGLVSVDEAISISRMLVELAQVNSACLEAQFNRHKPDGHIGMIESADSWHTMQYEKSTFTLIDDEDYYRVGRFFRGYTGPITLAGLATEGLIEDFFGAWASPEEEPSTGEYNPDHTWNLLLDIN